MISKVTKDRAGICSINIAFGEYIEISIEVVLDEFLDFRLSATFLVEEFIAWEGKNFKTFAAELVMHFHHLLIVR